MRIAELARFRALKASGGDASQMTRLCEHETVRVSLDNLMTFPWVRERVEQGKLDLHGCYFEVERGKLDLLLQYGRDMDGQATKAKIDAADNENSTAAIA